MPVDPPKFRPTPEIVVGLLLLAMSIAVMFIQLQQPYWLDEAFSVFVARQPVLTLVRYAAVDIHPPGYFLLLKFWGHFFSYGEAATAVLSLLLMGAAGVLTYRLGRRLADRRTAWVAAVLFGSSAAAVNYATETRMYALLLVAALISTISTHGLATRRRPSDWWLWLAASAFGVYTHYYYWVLVYAQNFVFAVLARRQTDAPRLMRRWIAFQFALIALYLPWLPAMVERLLDKYLVPNWFAGFSPSFGDGIVFTVGVLMVNLPGHEAGWMMRLPMTVVALLPIVGIGAVVSRLQVGRWFATLRLRPPTVAGTLIGFSVLAPIGFLAFFDSLLPRYVLYVAPLIAVGVALAIRRLSYRARMAVVAALAAVMVGGNWWYALKVTPHRSIYNWHRLARYLKRQPSSPRDLILTVAFEEQVLLEYYYRGGIPVHSFLPSEYLRSDGPTTSRIRRIGLANITPENAAEIASVVIGRETIWVVDGGAGSYADRGGNVVQWLRRHCREGAMVDLLAQPLDSSPLTVTQYVGCTVDDRTSPAIDGASEL